MQIKVATTSEKVMTEFYEANAERNTSKLALFLTVQRYQPQKETLWRHTDGRKRGQIGYGNVVLTKITTKQ